MNHSEAKEYSSPGAEKKKEARVALIRSAVRLMGMHGVSGVSLNEIVRQAGQRNASALHYHFGNRAGLIQAIFDYYTPAIEARRMQMIQALLDSPDASAVQFEDIAHLVVMPLVEQLDRQDGGRDYLRFTANVHHQTLDPDPQDQRENRALEGLQTLTASLTEGMPSHLLLSRKAMAKAVVLHSLSDYCRQCDRDSGYDQRQRGDFVQTLTGALTSIFTAPYSHR